MVCAPRKGPKTKFNQLSTTVHDNVIRSAMPVGDAEGYRIEHRHPRMFRLPRLSRRRNAVQQFRKQAGKGCGNFGFCPAAEDSESGSYATFRNQPDRYPTLLRFILQSCEWMREMNVPVSSVPPFLLQEDEIGDEPFQQLGDAPLGEIALHLSDRRIHSLPPLKECSMPLKYRVWDGLVGCLALLGVVVIAFGIMLRIIDASEGLRRLGLMLDCAIFLTLLPSVIVGIWSELSMGQKIGILTVLAVGMLVLFATGRRRPSRTGHRIQC